MELIILLAACLGLVTAAIAHKKGHNPFTWWLAGSLFFIIALPLAIILEPKQDVVDERKLRRGMKQCPDCAELVKQDALICRFCRHEFRTVIERSQLGSDMKLAQQAMQKAYHHQTDRIKAGLLKLRCACNACRKPLEFDAMHIGERVECPHCNEETRLFIDSKQ
jgi:hypothetical protein